MMMWFKRILILLIPFSLFIGTVNADSSNFDSNGFNKWKRQDSENIPYTDEQRKIDNENLKAVREANKKRDKVYEFSVGEMEYEVTVPWNGTKEDAWKKLKKAINYQEPAPVKSSISAPTKLITLSLVIMLSLYAFFSKLDSGQKFRLLIVSSVAWVIYVYFFDVHRINDKFFINTLPVWLFWSFYFVKGKKELLDNRKEVLVNKDKKELNKTVKKKLSNQRPKELINNYLGAFFDYDKFVPGKANFIHFALSILAIYFVLYFLPKGGISSLVFFALVAIATYLIAVLPLNIAKEKKLINNNKSLNKWIAYCLFAWPVALVHSLLEKKKSNL